MTVEAKEGLAVDPATPTHTPEPATVLDGDVKPPNTDPEGNPLPEEANQGGDPEGTTIPEKEEQDPTPDAPDEVDLTDENQQVAEAVAAAGLKPDELRAAMEKNGGTVPLKALQAMVKEHGESVANAMADQLKGMYTAGEAAKEAANTAVYNAFQKEFEGSEEGSGKQHFENAAAWARENLSTEERNGISDLINSSNEYVRNLGIAKLAESYQNSDKYTQAGDLLTGDNLATTNVTVLDKTTYQRELTALMDKGYSYESREVQSLQNRRTAAIRRGQ